MSLFARLFGKKKKCGCTGCRPRQARPMVEGLESRLVAYAATSNAWPVPQLITIGFVPDGTALDGGPSNLISTLNTKFGSAAAWQNQILKAAQTWAQQTNINFAIVGDNGAALGTGSYEQGDPNMADIRIGGYNFGNTALAQAYLPPPVDNTSVAGDVEFNTSQSFSVPGVSGSYDLYTVALHEIGHSLGLLHSGVGTAAMYTYYTAAKTGLGADDIAGIRSVYSSSAVRQADSFDAAAGDTSFAAAADVTSQLDPTNLNAVVNNLDVTSAGLARYYKVTVPTGALASAQIVAQSSGLSLLEPKLTVYASNQTTVLGTASYSGTQGGTVTVNLSSLTAGQVIYIKVQGTDNTAFGTGAFALGLNFGTAGMPAVTPPSTQTAIGSVTSIGGGTQAIQLNPQFQLDASTGAAQQTNSATAQSVAIDGSGNYVSVWSSQGEDGSGLGVYARLFYSNGTPFGPAFRVNTTTAGDQTFPSVAMAPNGSFVVTWSSNGQDGSGWGVYAQRYAAGGTAVGGEFRVNTTTQADQKYSSVAIDPAGAFVISWSSANQDGSGWGVYAQRYNADGTTNGGEFQVNSTTAGDQMYSTVAMDNNGNFTIVWSSADPSGSGWDIDGQRYNANGTANGSQFQVNPSPLLAQATPALAMDGATGGFVVTWSALQTGNPGSQVYAKLYNGLGAAQGSPILVSDPTMASSVGPAVAMDTNGNFLISWSSEAAGSTNWDVYAQQYGPGGIVLGTIYRVNTLTGGDQGGASVALDSKGDAVVVWTSQTSGAASTVWGQTYLLTGGVGQAAMTAADGLVAAGVPLPTHGPGCTCPLCQALAARQAGAQAVQIVNNVVVYGGTTLATGGLSLPVVSPLATSLTTTSALTGPVAIS